ncbi:MAG TPA: hypothetical protein VFC52_06540, partial [Solirubrobacterales bacterium]|nr:hypothetical protein [Solirubrobacterales bacterium]
DEDTEVLRDAGVRPKADDSLGTPSPSEISPATIAREKFSVASDGRFFFAATSNKGSDAGKNAIFARKGPSEVVNVSQAIEAAEKATLGARYAGASPDGGKVFFLANYGIAATSSSGPTENCSNVSMDNSIIRDTACDLYAYDLEEEELTDVSAHVNPADTKGAVVQSTMAISEDGSVVYFSARGQLVPGEGRTYAQNLEGAGYANVYRYEFDAEPADALTYVGSLTAGDVRNQASILSTASNNNLSAQTNSDGSYFLYASRDDLGINNPLGVESAYLFSAATGSSVCVSCQADGSAPKQRPNNIILGIPSVIAGLRAGGSNVPPVSLSEDGRVIFNSEEVLAPGAIEGQGEALGTAGWLFVTQTNIYEWNQGQVSTLATGAVETLGMGGPNGRDVFIKSFSRLSPHDFDFSADVYDIRSGGGFPPPPEAPQPCDPTEGACQSAASAQPASSRPASSDFVGGGNLNDKGKSNPCAASARRAQRLAKRAKALRAKARRASGAAAKRRLARRAQRAAKAAGRNSQAAKRCRRRARAAPCAASARRAQRLAKQAKALRAKARRASGAAAKRRPARRAQRAAKAAGHNSQAAKRCRRRARAANYDRGGTR